MLDLLNFFRIWIPNFPLLAKLLYDATKKCLDEPLFNPSSLDSPLRQLTQSHLYTCQITPNHSFSLPIPNKDKPWDFYVSGPETPGLP